MKTRSTRQRTKAPRTKPPAAAKAPPVPKPADSKIPDHVWEGMQGSPLMVGMARLKKVAIRTGAEIFQLHQDSVAATGRDREDGIPIGALAMEVVSGGSSPQYAMGILRLVRQEIEVLRHSEVSNFDEGTYDSVMYNLEEKLGLAIQLVEREWRLHRIESEDRAEKAIAAGSTP
jgi:hypothetical protein